MPTRARDNIVGQYGFRKLQHYLVYSQGRDISIFGAKKVFGVVVIVGQIRRVGRMTSPIHSQAQPWPPKGNVMWQCDDGRRTRREHTDPIMSVSRNYRM